MIRALAILLALTLPAVAAQIPHAARRYRADFTRTVRYVWGLSAPVAVMASQVQQESAWNPDAKSAYAAGLAQFTPQTAIWISGVYRLGEAQPTNPAWAMRALATYDRHLFKATAAATDCDHWAFTLSAYNGGLGWLHRDIRLTKAAGADPSRWWGSVANYTHRADWAKRENRSYPRRILLTIQPLYLDWGPGVACLCGGN